MLLHFLENKSDDLALVMNAVPNGLVIIDDKGSILYVNEYAEKLFQYSSEELLGKKSEMLLPSRYHQSHPVGRSSFFQSPERRKMGLGREMTGLRKDGVEVPLEVGLNPVESRGRQLVVAAIVDISERKRVESELQLAYENVQQKNLEMEQFVYTVSHDLKAPLVTSMAFVNFIQEDLSTFLESLPEDHRDNSLLDEVRDSMSRLTRAHERMHKLIADLLDLSRLVGAERHWEDVDIGSLIETLKDYLDEKAKGTAIQFVFPESYPTVHVDRANFYRVFENLMTNAIKYGCSLAHPTITLRWHETETDTVFCISDNGKGIEEKFHQKIFGLFQRLETDNDGTGVGLTIVARIMALMGGKVWVASNAGQGAHFWFSVPKASN